MAQTVVGLDIGATSIKMIRLEASLFRFEFVDFSEHPLPVNVDLPWEQLVTNVLQVLFSDRGMKADRVVVSLPGRNVSARILTLPFSDRKKIDQTLPFEIESLIPLPLEDILLDYQVLEKTPEGAKVLVLFTEKSFLESHLDLLKEAGIDPNVILPSSVALANLWKEVPSDEQEPFAVVDFGESETSLCVVHNGGIRYGRAWTPGTAGPGPRDPRPSRKRSRTVSSFPRRWQGRRRRRRPTSSPPPRRAAIRSRNGSPPCS